MSIFSSLIPEAHPNHNVFDLSRRDVLSIKSAMATPVFVQHTIPNATYEIQPMNQIQVSTMAKANFARLKQNLEYYFVPYSQLWRWFETFYYQRGDVVRNSHNNPLMPVPESVPYLDLCPLINYLWVAYLYQFQFESALSVFKELDLIGTFKNDGDLSYVDLVRNFLHQFNTAKYYIPSTDYVLQPITVAGFVDVHHIPACENALRILDNLGYCNWLSVFKDNFDYLIYAPVNSEDTTHYKDRAAYVTALKTYVQTNMDNVVWRPNASFDVNDFVSSMSESLFNSGSDLTLDYIFDSKHDLFNFDNKVNPLPILAYLKIWSDNFRNVQYDNNNYSYFYNIDYLSSAQDNEVDLNRIINCLIPRYRLYRRDIITGTYPNAQFGDAALASIQNPTTITGTENPDPDMDGAFVDANKRLYYGGVDHAVDTWNINTGISALAIRQAEALQRYREKNLRAGSRLKNQQNAFFGDKSRYLDDDYSQFLYSDDSGVQIQSVVATAESNEISLGDKGSISYSEMSSKGFTFHSHDFGMIIGIMYILPIAEYENYGFDPQVMKLENGDYFHPDLQNLGLSPVYNSIVNFVKPVPSDVGANPSVLGFSAHDWEYKCALDKVHGEFNDMNGIFGDFVTPRSRSLFDSLTLNTLYASPADIDNIFIQSSDSTQASDQFKINLYHQVKAVLPMSVTGLPY